MVASQRTKILILIPLIVLLGAMLLNLQGEYAGYGSAGTHDFIAYWSATRLILEGGNPYNRDALYRVEKGLGWPEERPWLAMNPPWLGIVLAPFGLLPFREAVFLWLLSNMLVMGLATYFLWQVFAIEANGRFLWAAMATAFLFPQTLSAIFSGQVSPLVLLGISGTLFYIERNRGFWAGAMLVLTTLKPQLICLLLPGILLWSVRQKRWGVPIGFSAALLALLFPLQLLFPNWLPSYLTSIIGSPPLDWFTPTIGGAMSYYQGTTLSWAKLLWVAFLPVVLIPLYRREETDWPAFTSLLLLLTLPTTTFAWGIDQVILVVPLLQIVAWLVSSRLRGRARARIVSALFVCYVILATQRFILRTNEVFYLWTPFLVAAIYLSASSGRAQSTHGEAR